MRLQETSLEETSSLTYLGFNGPVPLTFKGEYIMSAETVEEITILQNALVALNEGASDEKRAAMEALESMLLRKVETLLEFERNYDDLDM